MSEYGFLFGQFGLFGLLEGFGHWKVSDHWKVSNHWEFSEHKNAKGEHTNYQNQGHNKAQPKTTLPAV